MIGLKNLLKDPRFEKYSRQLNISRFRLLLLFLIARFQSGCNLKEFFYYDLYCENSIGLGQYIFKSLNKKLNRKYNDRLELELIAEKEELNHLFSRFTKRDFCGHKYNSTKEDYEKFSQKHDKCIIKPKTGYGGEGIRIISIKEDLNGKSLYDFCHENNCFVEELIVQHPKMASIHSASVNSVRVFTVCGNPIAATLRMGCGGSSVDNAHSGGYYAAIDLHTGIVFDVGQNDNLEQVIRHPDSGVIIPGFEIPFFAEALELCKEASKLISKINILGWDIAITHSGPVMIEVNNFPGFRLYQRPIRKGLRSKILKALSEKQS